MQDWKMTQTLITVRKSRRLREVCCCITWFVQLFSAMIREHPDISWHLNSFQRKQTLLAPKIADRIQMIVCFGSTLDHKLYLEKQIISFFLSVFLFFHLFNRNEATANSFYFHTWQDRVNMQRVIWFLMTENEPLQISIIKQTGWEQTLNKLSSELRTADLSLERRRDTNGFYPDSSAHCVIHLKN